METKNAEYLIIAKSFLCFDDRKVNHNICATIRIQELSNSNNVKETMQNILKNICYDFTKVRLYKDSYGIAYIMFYN